MNCCDYNCTQDRDCPARKSADVAHIGQGMPAAEPLPPPADHLRHLARWMLTAFAALFITLLISITIHLWTR